MGRRAELSLLLGLGWHPVDLTVAGWQDVWKGKSLRECVSSIGVQAEEGQNMGAPHRLHGRGASTQPAWHRAGVLPGSPHLYEQIDHGEQKGDDERGWGRERGCQIKYSMLS